MTDQVRGTEEFFLKIVKHAILGMMGLALIAIPLLLMFGGFKFMSQPKEPEPAKVAPVKAVTMEGLQQYLIEQQRILDEKEKLEKSDQSKKKVSNEDMEQVKHLGDAVKIQTCALGFAKATDQPIEVAGDRATAQAEEVGRISKELESASRQQGRGGPYVNSLVDFLCKALGDPSVIALRKGEKIRGGVIRTITRFHNNAWDAIYLEKQRYDNSETARVLTQRAAEAVRIATDRALAMTGLTAAGIAFGAFMLLAIYLILAKIETNMREINGSIRGRESSS